MGPYGQAGRHTQYLGWAVGFGVVVMSLLGLRTYRASVTTQAYLAGLDEILEMQDEIAQQLADIEQNATAATEVVRLLKERKLDLGDTPGAVAALEADLLGQLGKLQAAFDKQAAEIRDISKGSVETFRNLVERGAEARAAGGGGAAGGEAKWVVKWHNNGVNTSPVFTSEASAYRYYVNVGDFAKKLIGFDGARWMVIKSYGGANWLALMTDDGTYQS